MIHHLLMAVKTVEDNENRLKAAIYRPVQVNNQRFQDKAQIIKLLILANFLNVIWEIVYLLFFVLSF